MTAFWNQHPQYQIYLDDWVLCRDCHKGERAVKSKRDQYLPATYGMIADGYPNATSKGGVDYQNYIARAVFPGYTKEAVKTYLGMLWHKDAKIELPAKMEDLRDNATRANETLLQLLRSMHEEMLTTGRLGLLADMPKSKDGVGTTEEPKKYITMYKAERIINWDEGEKTEVIKDSLNLVVIDETTYKRNADFTWDKVNQFRVLSLGDIYLNEEARGNAVYSTGMFSEDSAFDPAMMTVPAYRGKPLNHIPFVFVNSKDCLPEPDEPPLLGLANRDMVIYRTEADYRQTLYMQGQYTLVITGAEVSSVSEDGDEGTTRKPIRTGAGSVIELTNPQADAKYIGIEGVALPEQRSALENDRRSAEIMAGSLTDTRSNEKESGDAMSTRIAGQTASLNSIATTAAFALQSVLRSIAEWMGLNPDDVKVTPNKDFTYKKLTPKDLLDLQGFKNSGGPITEESVHLNTKRAGLTDMDYEDEKEQLDQEEPRIDMTGGLVGTEPNPMDQEKLDMEQANAEHQQQMDKENVNIAKKAQADKAKSDMVRARQKPKPGAK